MSAIGAISAVAARRNKQKLADDDAQSTVTAAPEHSRVEAGPPLKRPKSFVGQTESRYVSVKEAGVGESTDTSATKSIKRSRRTETSALSASQEEGAIEGADYVSLNDAEVLTTADRSVSDNRYDFARWVDGLYNGTDFSRSSEPQTAASQKWEDFLLSRSRLGKQDIVYNTHDAVCLRLKLKSV